MFRLTRLLARSIGLAVALALVPTSALAVTADELIELRRAGLGDEVLIALIETTGMSSAVESEVVLRMKREGLSDRVIAAAVRAVPPPPDLAPAPAAEPAPNVAAIGYDEPPAYVVDREVIYIPWVVPVDVKPGRPHAQRPYFEGDRKFGRFINDGTAPAPRRKALRR